jgi:non-specific serine/threonine protein kinase
MMLRGTAALWYFWALRGRYLEGRTWLGQALDDVKSRIADRGLRTADQVHSSQPHSTSLANALNAAGKLAEKHGDWTRAQSLLEESLALSRQQGDIAGEAMSLLYLGRTARDRGDYARAEALEQQSLELSRDMKNTWGIRWALFSLGDTALDQGKSARAEELFEEGLQLCYQLDDNNGIAVSLLNLGRVAAAQGDGARALERYHASLTMFREQGSPLGVAEVLQGMGRVAYSQGDAVHAAAYHQEGLGLLKDLGINQIIALCLEGLAAAAGSLGWPERAAWLFGAAEHLREMIAIPLSPAYRAAYDHDLAAARAGLDAVAWAANWAAGRALPLDQAIAEACRMPLDAAAGSMPAPAQPAGAAGEPHLTPRERQVIALIARGYSNRMIADALVIAERTAEIHVGNILGKLGFTSRAQAAAYAVAQGLADATAS